MMTYRNIASFSPFIAKRCNYRQNCNAVSIQNEQHTSLKGKKPAEPENLFNPATDSVKSCAKLCIICQCSSMNNQASSYFLNVCCLQFSAICLPKKTQIPL